MNFINDDKKQLNGGVTDEKRNIQSKELGKCLLRLEYKRNLLERDIQAFINDTNINSRVKQRLHDVAEKCMKRPDDIKGLKKDIWIISNDLKAVKSMIDDIQRLDVNMYKKRLSQLAYKIHCFKTSLNPGALADEQVGLESSINTILVKYNIK